MTPRAGFPSDVRKVLPTLGAIPVLRVRGRAGVYGGNRAYDSRAITDILLDRLILATLSVRNWPARDRSSRPSNAFAMTTRPAPGRVWEACELSPGWPHPTVGSSRRSVRAALSAVSVAMIIIAIAGACGRETVVSSDAPLVFPEAPAVCAGPERAGYSRQEQWETVVTNGSIRAFAVSLATTRTPDEVAALVPDSLAVTAVLVVYRESQGTYAKAFLRGVEPDEDLATLISSSPLRRHLDSTGPSAPADPTPLQRGEYPIGGLWLEGDREALREWVSSHRCEIWALAPTSETTHPMPSPVVDPT